MGDDGERGRQWSEGRCSVEEEEEEKPRGWGCVAWRWEDWSAAGRGPGALARDPHLLGSLLRFTPNGSAAGRARSPETPREPDGSCLLCPPEFTGRRHCCCSPSRVTGRARSEGRGHRAPQLFPRGGGRLQIYASLSGGCGRFIEPQDGPAPTSLNSQDTLDPRPRTLSLSFPILNRSNLRVQIWLRGSARR